MEDNNQTGCELGVLNQISKNGKEISNREVDGKVFKKFPGVCMYRRSHEWTGDLLSEVFIPSTFVVIHSGEIEKLTKTIKSLNKVKALKPIKLIICHDTHNLKEIKDNANIFNGKSECVYLIDKIYKDIMYDEAFKRAKNGWVFFLQSGKEVPSNYLEVVNFNKTHY